MNIKILSIFPEMFKGILSSSIVHRAIKNKIVDIECINIRDFSRDKHKNTDDYPYGGGPGMVMMAQPIFDAMSHAMSTLNSPKRIFLSPVGEKFNQKKAQSLAQEKELIFLCGHYEGVDQRAIDLCVDEQISIGDYILTGGELPAMVIIDSLVRLLPGALGNCDSLEYESFTDNLLEYPHYTRPRKFKGLAVPKVLLEGNHAKIDIWRKEQSLINTKKFRPDLLELDTQDKDKAY